MASIFGEHVWTAPYWQVVFDVLISVGCRHVSGLLLRPFIAAGPDVFRRSHPRQVIALISASSQRRVFPIPVSTAFITPSAPHQLVYRKAKLCGHSSKLCSIRHERPGNARHLIGHSNGHDGVRFARQHSSAPHPCRRFRDFAKSQNSGCSDDK